MFRFLHAADAHIDSPMDGLSTYDVAPTEQLRGATRTAFENLVRLAVDEQVDFVVFAGDLYDGDWKDFSTGLFLTRQVRILADSGIPLFLIAGNHDAASVLTRRLTLPDTAHYFSTRTAETKLLSDLPVAIHGRGFPDRAVPENLAIEYPAAVADYFNIGLLHTSLSGLPGHDTYAPCSVSDLADRGYQYWALGHIHQPQIIREDPCIVFPGNLQGRHVRETGPRGCRLITVNSALQIEANEFRPLDVVRWNRISVDLTGTRDKDDVLVRVEEALRHSVSEVAGRLLAVRIELTGATPLHALLRADLPTLRAECVNQAQLAAGDQIWIEEIRSATSPLQSLAELAERDELTRIVLDSLHAAEAGLLELPAAVSEMLKVLPADVRAAVEADWETDDRSELIDDVRSVLLNAIAAKSGET